jgi:hypothetical protein
MVNETTPEIEADPMRSRCPLSQLRVIRRGSGSRRVGGTIQQSRDGSYRLLKYNANSCEALVTRRDVGKARCAMCLAPALCRQVMGNGL